MASRPFSAIRDNLLPNLLKILGILNCDAAAQVEQALRQRLKDDPISLGDKGQLISLFDAQLTPDFPRKSNLSAPSNFDSQHGSCPPFTNMTVILIIAD
jgi:hypothetical protein